MKITLSNVISITESLNALSEAELNLDLAFVIDDYAREMFKHKTFFEKQKNQMLQKYGKQVNNQFFIDETSENWGVFKKLYQELLIFEVEIEKLKITENDLRNIKNIKLKLKDVSTLRTILS